jgi:6-pyruvoyltetrahydropterin/6-carboxytetrahydropterin synthase
MYTVTKIIHFCYGHRLLNYNGKCRHLHGHNGRAEIELTAKRLDRLGMVEDFTKIKRAIQGWIDETLDHKMILCQDDPALPALRKLDEPLFVMRDNPTAERLAQLIYEEARRMGFPVASVRLWETESSYAVYSLDGRATARTRWRSGRGAEPGRNRTGRARRRGGADRRVRSISTAA